VRASINTFLGYFMDDYAKKFNFKSYSKARANNNSKHALAFGDRNPGVGVDGYPIETKSSNNKTDSSNSTTTTTTTTVSVNLMNLSEQQIRGMKASELKAALIRYKIDVTDCLEKDQLVEKALRLCC
jgi:hypothetical protein